MESFDSEGQNGLKGQSKGPFDSEDQEELFGLKGPKMDFDLPLFGHFGPQALRADQGAQNGQKWSKGRHEVVHHLAAAFWPIFEPFSGPSASGANKGPEKGPKRANQRPFLARRVKKVEKS